MKSVKKANTTMLLLSIVLIIAIVCFAVISFAWYSVSVNDVSADLNIETNSVYTFEVLHASFFTPNDILSASVGYANNQYPNVGSETDSGNISKLRYATLAVDYKIYNNTGEDEYVFSIIGLEIYAPGIVSEHDEPLYKVNVGVGADGTKTLEKSKEGVIIDRITDDLVFCFAPSKDADDHADWTPDEIPEFPTAWQSVKDAQCNFSLSKDGTVYLAVAFNKYDDLIDEAIYNGIQIKVLVSMERAKTTD